MKASEFDKNFDEGKDISKYLDVSQRQEDPVKSRKG
jgi:hypothetical protein